MSAAPPSTVSRGVVLMILAVFLFTTMDATAKGLIERYPAPQVIWVRFAGQFALVLLILGPRLGPVLRTRFPVLHFWRSASQFGATTFFFLSLPHVGLAEATAVADLNPVLITLGADPLWLGVLIALNLQTSFLTPPFGFSLFYLRSVAPPEVTTGHIYRGIVPFVVIQLLAIAAVWTMPPLATGLPRRATPIRVAARRDRRLRPAGRRATRPRR